MNAVFRTSPKLVHKRLAAPESTRLTHLLTKDVAPWLASLGVRPVMAKHICWRAEKTWSLQTLGSFTWTHRGCKYTVAMRTDAVNNSMVLSLNGGKVVWTCKEIFL